MDIKIRNNELKFKYRVSCIIICDDEVLLEKYGEDNFCLPGGYVELGETSKEAVLRKIKEETNFLLNEVNYIGIIENFFTNIRNDKTHEIDIYYKTNIIKEDKNKIDLKKKENDKGNIVNHNLKWIKIKDLDKIKPLLVIKIIKNNIDNFHYINIDKDIDKL